MQVANHHPPVTTPRPPDYDSCHAQRQQRHCAETVDESPTTTDEEVEVQILQHAGCAAVGQLAEYSPGGGIGQNRDECRPLRGVCEIGRPTRRRRVDARHVMTRVGRLNRCEHRLGIDHSACVWWCEQLGVGEPLQIDPPDEQRAGDRNGDDVESGQEPYDEMYLKQHTSHESGECSDRSMRRTLKRF
jgi:hypothetical protein